MAGASAAWPFPLTITDFPAEVTLVVPLAVARTAAPVSPLACFVFRFPFGALGFEVDADAFGCVNGRGEGAFEADADAEPATEMLRAGRVIESD